MSGAKVSPAKNPFHISQEEDLQFMNKKAEFHSEVFHITKDGLGSDNDEYEELMNEMYPFDQSSNKILNPYSKPIKTTDANGDITIHIEYLVLEEEEDHLMKRAKKKAEKEGRSDDEEYINKMYRKMGGDQYVSW